MSFALFHMGDVSKAFADGTIHHLPTMLTETVDGERACSLLGKHWLQRHQLNGMAQQ